MAPNPNYMADEFVRETTLRLCLSGYQTSFMPTENDDF
jgi:hypothetical protein